MAKKLKPIILITITEPTPEPNVELSGGNRGYNGLGVHKKSESSATLTDAEIAAMGFIKSKLTDQEIAALGYKKTDNNTHLTDAEIAAMGYIKTVNNTVKLTYFSHSIPLNDTNDVIDIFKDYFTDLNLQPNRVFDIDFFISMDGVSGGRLTDEMYKLIFRVNGYDQEMAVAETKYNIPDYFVKAYRFKFHCDVNTRVWHNTEGSYQKDASLNIIKIAEGSSTFNTKANLLVGNSFRLEQTTSKGLITISAVIKEYM